MANRPTMEGSASATAEGSATGDGSAPIEGLLVFDIHENANRPILYEDQQAIDFTDVPRLDQADVLGQHRRVKIWNGLHEIASFSHTVEHEQGTWIVHHAVIQEFVPHERQWEPPRLTSIPLQEEHWAHWVGEPVLVQEVSQHAKTLRRRLKLQSIALNTLKDFSLAPTLLDVVRQGDTSFIVTGFPKGTSLREVLDGWTRKTGFANPRFSLQIVLNVLKAVAKCHKLGIVHGNIQTKSVFLSPTCDVQLGNFSFAMRVGHPEDAAVRSGRPEYDTKAPPPPWQVSGSFDSWGLSEVCVEVLFGSDVVDALRAVHDRPTLTACRRQMTKLWKLYPREVRTQFNVPVALLQLRNPHGLLEQVAYSATDVINDLTLPSGKTCVDICSLPEGQVSHQQRSEELEQLLGGLPSAAAFQQCMGRQLAAAFPGDCDISVQVWEKETSTWESSKIAHEKRADFF